MTPHSVPLHPTHRPRRVALLRAVLHPAYRALLRLDVEGRERIPLEGPCIFVFNHLSNLDAHMLFTLVRRPDATGLVAASYRARPLHRWLVEAGGGTWLRRGEGDRAALRLALGLLRQGWLVGLAPEGGRSPDGVLRRGRPGAAFLAIRSGAPVLPVAVEGTNRWREHLRRGRRAPVSVRVGRPFVPAAAAEAGAPGGRRARVDAVTLQIMTALAALLPPWRRGPYAQMAPGEAP